MYKNFRFYEWIDKKWGNSIRPNLIAYPEGHRMFDSAKPGKLKRGMIGVFLYIKYFSTLFKGKYKSK